jgi:hypothetical protein
MVGGCIRVEEKKGGDKEENKVVAYICYWSSTPATVNSAVRSETM